MSCARNAALCLGLVTFVGLLLFEPLFTDACLLSADNRMAPPFRVHAPEPAPVRPMNFATLDLNVWLMPETLVQLERMKRGELPLWNERELLGTPRLATLGFQPFYPGTLAYWCLPPLRALAVTTAMHLFLLALGSWFFFRRRGWSSLAAGGTALATAGCAFTVVHLHNPNIPQTLAWTPWLLVAVERLVERPTRRHAALLAAAVACCLLAGFPQLAVLELLTAGAWWVTRLAGARHLSPRRNVAAASAAAPVPAHAPGIASFTRQLLLAGAALLLGASGAAVQMLPALEMHTESHRAGGLHVDAMQRKRFAAPSLIGFVLPHFFGPAVHEVRIGGTLPPEPWTFPTFRRWQEVEVQNGFEENAVWLGLIPLVLALLSLGRRADRAGWFARGLMLVSLLSAMAAPGVAHVVALVPGLGTGSPKRALWLTSFALIWMAGSELERVVRGHGRGRALQAAGVALLALGAAALLPYERWLLPDASSADQQWFRATLQRDLWTAGAAGVVLLAAGVWVRREMPRGAAALLVLATLIQALEFGRHLNPPQDSRDQYRATPAIEWLRAREGRMVSFGSGVALPGSMAQVFELRSCQGLVSMVNRRTAELFQALEPDLFAADNPITVRPLQDWRSLSSPLLDLMGAHHVVTSISGHLLLQEHAAELPDLEFVYANEDELLAIYRRRTALPPAFVAARVQVEPDRQRRLALLGDPSFRPAELAVIEQQVDGLPDAPARGTARYERLAPELIRVVTNSDAPAVVVIGETASAGWQAEVNGAPSPVLRTDHCMMGVVVPAGSARVVLRYRPASFRLGAAASAVSLMVLLVMLGRRPPPSQEQARRRDAGGSG